MERSKQRWTTEQVSRKSQNLDLCEVGEIIELMNDEDKTVAKAVEKALPQIESAIKSIVDALRSGGRLFYVGAGTSGRLGILDASECPPTFGVSPLLVNGLIAGGEMALKHSIEDAEDDEDAGRAEILEEVEEGDAVVGIAASGWTPYVIGAVTAAREKGAVTVGLSCNENTKLSECVQYPIEVPVGPEIVAGSTRLKAGTAQKMVLNMISTTSMIKLGKVYGNLMVNVQATNQKLRRRVVEIVKEVAGVSEEEAKAVAERAQGDARAALLMVMCDIDQERAAQALKAANGHFREAMAFVKHLNRQG
ncbi:MAG TPA: N-acetylmuramic acid 6-phosphate etherase [Bacillales bacterium]|nr:N-acetylmuramic acid 6-phosphate etherase [Bacillales bacterium]